MERINFETIKTSNHSKYDCFGNRRDAKKSSKQPPNGWAKKSSKKVPNGYASPS